MPLPLKKVNNTHSTDFLDTNVIYKERKAAFFLKTNKKNRKNNKKNTKIKFKTVQWLKVCLFFYIEYIFVIKYKLLTNEDIFYLKIN